MQSHPGKLLFFCWLAYLGFVLVTDWGSFGLTAQPEKFMRWTLVRLATATPWFLLSWFLLSYRQAPVNWKSFLASALATTFVALIALPTLVPGGSNMLAAAGSVLFYSLISGFLCLTVRTTAIATLLGVFLFVLQFFLDAAAHLFSGVFALH